MIVLPDAEAVILAALRHYLDNSVRVMVEVPAQWWQHLPLVACRRVSGVAPDPRHFDQATVQVNCFAETRRAASHLGRTVRGSLFQAAHDQFQADGGVLQRYREIVGPFLVRDEFTAEIPDLSRFSLSAQLNVRAVRATSDS
ncbi:hypothetical protein [Haloglycomyces albus]|uniref:phage tail termination protein n=1 Tax=Haloglycomyces albus TaxID=526067 RepID=UPI00046C96E0|nr:hypothetical protein [Haloglycomyces albus]